MESSKLDNFSNSSPEKERKIKLLSKIYFSNKFGGFLTGKNKVFKIVKKIDPSITKKDVNFFF